MQWRVSVDGDATSAVFEPADAGKALFVCAHGAGGDMNDRAIRAASQVLRAKGFDLVRFNFLYREKGSRRPDPMPRLKACYQAVLAHVRRELKPAKLIVGGRSMGGRAASLLAAEGEAVNALLLLAYPLHRAGQPQELRDAHLPRIQVPVLCLNGTRDTLCNREVMEGVVRTLPASFEMHWLEGADHGFHVLKSFGRTDADVLAEVGEVAGRWLSRLAR
jgi:uncharacterized protein